MQSVDTIYSELAVPKKIVITMHQKPDPDAMGSGLGLYHFLKQLDHQVTVIARVWRLVRTVIFIDHGNNRWQ